MVIHVQHGPEMKVAVAFDHRGVHLREAVLGVLAAHEVIAEITIHVGEEIFR